MTNTMTEDSLCVIPARGGSKRLPKKNIREIDGKPMISYSIEAAQESNYINKVFVATDDEEIADVAREFGASVPYLMPDDICGDLVPSHEPAQHLAESLADEDDYRDTIVLLQPTSPLRIPSDIDRGIDKYSNSNSDFVISVTDIDPHYFHWAMKEGENGYWEMHFGDLYMKERPLLPDRYRPNGSIKIADLAALQDQGNFFGERCEVIETPRRRSIHVGDGFEFDLAESLLERRSSKWGDENA